MLLVNVYVFGEKTVCGKRSRVSARTRRTWRETRDNDPMLIRRRWANIGPALVHCFVFAGHVHVGIYNVQSSEAALFSHTK